MKWNFSQYLPESKNENFFGRFVIDPLQKGEANLIGNALRRILLSSIPGVAITSVLIDGIMHEFTVIPGLYEEVPELILNLREIVFKLKGSEEATVIIEAEGEGDFYAKDLKLPVGVEIVNPDVYLFHLEEGFKLYAEIKIKIGRGFVSEEENKKEDLPINTIYVNSNFLPIKTVSYRVEPLEDNSERLILDIETNGSIEPRKALKIASAYIDSVLSAFSNMEEKSDISEEELEDELDEKSKEDDVLNRSVAELGLSRRASNCLKIGNIITIGELIHNSPKDLMKLKNFGQKSLNEIRERLREINLSLKDDNIEDLNGEVKDET